MPRRRSKLNLSAPPRRQEGFLHDRPPRQRARAGPWPGTDPPLIVHRLDARSPLPLQRPDAMGRNGGTRMKPSPSTRAVVLTLVFTLLSNLPGPQARADDADRRRQQPERGTRTPIKHVIVIIGENRTFDNVYATYVPRRGQSVANLLSKGIVHADGSPGPDAAAARQFQLARIDPASYFISTDRLTAPGKAAYATLPTPEAGGAPPQAVTLPQFLEAPAPSAPPFDAKTFSPAQLHTLSPVIEADDLRLLTTGATGLTNCTTDPTLPPSPCAEPDTRVANFDHLPN